MNVFWTNIGHEAYEKLEPLAETQKSRTTWFVLRDPLRLKIWLVNVHVSLTLRSRDFAYLTTFFTNSDLSSDVTFELGNDGCSKPDSSHCFAFGNWPTSFFTGSLSLSSSLREAPPPMFLASDWHRSGPSVSIACVMAPWSSLSPLLRFMNTVLWLVSYAVCL